MFRRFPLDPGAEASFVSLRAAAKSITDRETSPSRDPAASPSILHFTMAGVPSLFLSATNNISNIARTASMLHPKKSFERRGLREPAGAAESRLLRR